MVITLKRQTIMSLPVVLFYKCKNLWEWEAYYSSEVSIILNTKVQLTEAK